MCAAIDDDRDLNNSDRGNATQRRSDGEWHDARDADRMICTRFAGQSVRVCFLVHTAHGSCTPVRTERE